MPLLMYLEARRGKEARYMRKYDICTWLLGRRAIKSKSHTLRGILSNSMFPRLPAVTRDRDRRLRSVTVEIPISAFSKPCCELVSHSHPIRREDNRSLLMV